MICLACNSTLRKHSMQRKAFLKNQRKLDDLLQQSEFDKRPVKIDFESGSCVVIEAVTDVKLEHGYAKFNADLNNETSQVKKEIKNENLFPTPTARKPKLKLKKKSAKASPKQREIKVFSCDQCERQSGSSSNMARHKRKCHSNPKPETKFICELCSKQFTSSEGITRHIDMHNNHKKFECGKLRIFIRM